LREKAIAYPKRFSGSQIRGLWLAARNWQRRRDVFLLPPLDLNARVAALAAAASADNTALIGQIAPAGDLQVGDRHIVTGAYFNAPSQTNVVLLDQVRVGTFALGGTTTVHCAMQLSWSDSKNYSNNLFKKVRG
jgi:hypothetical protein